MKPQLRSSLFLTLCLLATACGTARSQVDYTLKFPQAKNHYVHIEASFDTTGKTQLEIFMPVWTPGSYLVREYARNIETISAVDQNKKPRLVSKTRKNRWVVDCEGSKSVTVQYRLYCHEMSVRTNWVEDSFAILNGAPTFLTTPEARQQTHRVKIIMPENWKDVSSALIPDPSDKLLFTAPTFDYLVDSPILIGNLDVQKFEQGGAKHQLVSLGGGEFWNFKKAAADVKKIVQAHQKLWQVVPYKEYKFLNAIVETGGGLEHDNSTLMMASRWSFGTRGRYVRWLSLVSHEFFHTWNIRRLRPVELVEYDFEKENYFRTLWIAEGITSYYDDLLVRRAGISSENEYLGQLSRQIRSVQTTEGRLTQSLAQSSYDTWIKFYRPDENSKNSQISYYTKGAVAGFLLDAEIRAATNNRHSLDDVMRELFKRYAGDKGYTSEQFRELASEIAGKDLTPWFEHAIDSTRELDFSTALDFFGLQFRDTSKSKGPKPVWTGMSLSADGGRVTVGSVIRNSPAFKAGINVGDELISIDGYRITSSDLGSRIKKFVPDDTTEVLLVRRGRILKRALKFEAKSTENWTLTRISKPTDEQKKALQDWLKPYTTPKAE